MNSDTWLRRALDAMTSPTLQHATCVDSAARVDSIRLHHPIDTKCTNGRRETKRWNKSDWHDYFNERAAVAEYDGQQPRDVAERMAYEACVVRWMDLHPVEQADAAVCPHCQRPNGEVGRSSVPVLNGNGHLWLHHACLQPMLTERRKQAIQQLGSYGLHSHDKSMASRQMCG